MIFCGIDCGNDGGVAIIRDNRVSCFRVKKDDDKCSVIISFLKQLDPFDTLVAIEKVHALAIAGPSSTFSFGWSVGFWNGVCDTLGFPVYLVEPKVWQAEITKPINRSIIPRNLPKEVQTKIRKERKLTIKAESIRTANELFPGCTITHDGIADAICIGAWLRYRYNLGELHATDT